MIAWVTGEWEAPSPEPGLDPSWILGLHLAAAEGLDHGTDVIFSYGPLGFLDEPSVVNGTTAVLSGLYEFGLRVALAVSFLWAGRRSFGLALAAAVALVATAITPGEMIPLSLAALWCLVAVQADAPPWSRHLLLIGGGAFAALESMIKLNIGLAIVAMVVVAAVAFEGRRLRNLGVLAAAFAVTGVGLWLAAGQGLGNLDDFVRASFEVISGYSASMQVRFQYVDWDRPVAALIVAATLAAGFLATRDLPRARRFASLAVIALLVFALVKQGFVRHNAGQVTLFTAGIVVPWIALRSRGAWRWVAAAAVAAIALVSWPMTGRELTSTLHTEASFERLRSLFDPGHREAVRDDARAWMRATYDLDPRIVRRIGSATVHTLPWEIGLTWAYGLNWKPLPVIQDYTAYTPELDETNAEALASADGPRFLLRHRDYRDDSPANIDGRYEPYDAPAETRTMLCGFRDAITTKRNQLLERTDDRCGAPRTVETVTAEFGETIPVPDAGPGEALFARVEGTSPEGIERLRTLLYRASLLYVRLDDEVFRLAGPTAQDGLLISAPPGTDFPEPFTLAPNPKEIAFLSEGGFATSGGPVEVEFYAVPVEREGTSARAAAGAP